MSLNEDDNSLKMEIISPDRTYLCSIISDCGMYPESITFEKEWPWRASAIISTTISDQSKPLEGKWGAPWVQVKFLTQNDKLVELAKRKYNIKTNSANISFIGTNLNNQRPHSGWDE